MKDKKFYSDMGQRSTPALVYVLGLVSAVLLVWLILEQGKVSECHEQMAAKQTASELSDQSVNKLADVFSSKVSKEIDHKKTDSKFEDKWDYNWDKMAPEKGETPSKERRFLILIRHGEYDFSTGKLTDLGREQANLTGLRLHQMNFPFTHIFHSNMGRAHETASIIHRRFPHLEITEDELLREGGPLPPTPTITYWYLPDSEYQIDGPRLEAAFRKHFHRSHSTHTQSTVDILVAHGNIIRYMVLRALQLEPSAWMRMFVAHASITVLECNSDSSVTMTKFGDTGHMPVHMVSY